MPVILKKNDEDVWLNPDIVEPERLLPLLNPYTPEDMEEWQVGDAARNPRNDTPNLIEPLHS
jgi:putative SOS response-associated peptidase YedK